MKKSLFSYTIGIKIKITCVNFCKEKLIQNMELCMYNDIQCSIIYNNKILERMK